MDNCRKHRANESGFALFVTMIVVLLVGILAVSGFRQNLLTETLSANSIQRSRAFQASDGALMQAENSASGLVQDRVFSSITGTDKVFSNGSVDMEWWRDKDFTGAITSSDSSFVGVIQQPDYIIEELGIFESDGGTGIVNLDLGAASYGRRTTSGREVVLYRFQSMGVGSTDTTKAITESLYIQNR